METGRILKRGWGGAFVVCDSVGGDDERRAHHLDVDREVWAASPICLPAPNHLFGTGSGSIWRIPERENLSECARS